MGGGASTQAAETAVPAAEEAVEGTVMAADAGENVSNAVETVANSDAVQDLMTSAENAGDDVKNTLAGMCQPGSAN